MCAKCRKFVLAIAFVMLIAIICVYVWGQKPGLLDSGIASVEGMMYVSQPLWHSCPITANDKDNPNVIKEVAAVLSSRHWDPYDIRTTMGRASLTLTLHNGKNVRVGCSTDNIVFIEGREYLVNKNHLQPALDALQKASLAKLPEGDTIALTGNILAVNGALDWPLGKNKKEYLVRFSTDKDPTEITEFERALSQRKPCHYREDAVVADLYVSLRDSNTWLVVETYKGGQVIIMENFRSGPNKTYGHCSEVDPAKLGAVYSLWLPKAECVTDGN